MKLDKERKLEKIYEVIADKTLSFGCIIDKCITQNWKAFYAKSMFWGKLFWDFEERKDWPSDKIIWHQVMIWDILDWIEKKFKLNIEEFDELESLFILWKDKRKSIDDQSDECIDFIYSCIL